MSGSSLAIALLAITFMAVEIISRSRNEPNNIKFHYRRRGPKLFAERVLERRECALVPALLSGPLFNISGLIGHKLLLGGGLRPSDKRPDIARNNKADLYLSPGLA